MPYVGLMQTNRFAFAAIVVSANAARGLSDANVGMASEIPTPRKNDRRSRTEWGKAGIVFSSSYQSHLLGESPGSVPIVAEFRN